MCVEFGFGVENARICYVSVSMVVVVTVSITVVKISRERRLKFNLLLLYARARMVEEFIILFSLSASMPSKCLAATACIYGGMAVRPAIIVSKN